MCVGVGGGAYEIIVLLLLLITERKRESGPSRPTPFHYLTLSLCSMLYVYYVKGMSLVYVSMNLVYLKIIRYTRYTRFIDTYNYSSLC